MATFARHGCSMEIVKRSVIILVTLATVFAAVEAQLELLYLRDTQDIVLTERGSVVKIPSLLTAITVVSRTGNEKNESLAATFAVSESNRSSARLQVLMFTAVPGAVFCSIGAVAPEPGDQEETSLRTIYDYWNTGGREPYDWRVPCQPARISFRENNASCALVLTESGDLQLLDVYANNVLWRSNTAGVGQANLTLDDSPTLSLYTAGDGRTRWESRVNESGGYDAKCSSFVEEDIRKPSSGIQTRGVCFCFFLPLVTSTAILLLSSL